MAKYGIQVGDRISARTPASVDEQGNKCGGHIPYKGSLEVTKVFSHGVRTKERGYVHNNNIIGKAVNQE